MHHVHAGVVVPEQHDLLDRIHHAGVVHQDDEVGNRRDVRNRDVQRRETARVLHPHVASNARPHVITPGSR